jgi:hypothetical protein
MRDNHEPANGDRPTEDQQTQAAWKSSKSFPTHAVVGVIDEPGDLLRAKDELRAAGFEPHVLSGERGVERIEHAGGSASEVRVTRAVQYLYGYESDHAEYHVAELTAGHFLLLVESHDDETADRIGHVFSEHGGHFVNYYSRWTSRTLLP